jgi:hypothetical protein
MLSSRSVCALCCSLPQILRAAGMLASMMQGRDLDIVAIITSFNMLSETVAFLQLPI